MATYAAESGDCGAISPVVVDTNNASSSVCTGPPPDLSSCSITINTTCPVGTSGQTLSEVGTAMWSADGESGTAHVQLQLLDSFGVAQCSGIYRITFTRFR